MKQPRPEFQIKRKIEHLEHSIKVKRHQLTTIKQDCDGLVFFMMERERELKESIARDARDIHVLKWALGEFNEM